MKDLGVIFDSELNFVQHCKEKINTAYSYLGNIKRNFIEWDEDGYYRPLIESDILYCLLKCVIANDLEWQNGNISETVQDRHIFAMGGYRRSIVCSLLNSVITNGAEWR